MKLVEILLLEFELFLDDISAQIDYNEVMKMKKVVATISLLCIFLVGCGGVNETRIEDTSQMENISEIESMSSSQEQIIEENSKPVETGGDIESNEDMGNIVSSESNEEITMPTKELKQEENSVNLQEHSEGEDVISQNLIKQNDITEIKIINGSTGEEKDIYDAEVIRNTVNELNQIGVKSQEKKNIQGYLYVIKLYNNESLVQSIYIYDTYIGIDGIIYNVDTTQDIIKNIK